MFRVYPRAFNTYLAGPDAYPAKWQDRLAQFNLVARVFIMNAIRNLRLHRTVTHLARWFGDDAVVGSNLDMTRTELLRLLNSAVHVMNTAEFIYNSSTCDDDTFAFVYPTAFDGVPDLQDAFRKNQKGQFVVYICPLVVFAEHLGLLADAIQTSVHESSHHEVAYLDDVAMCPQSHYIWLQTAGLPKLNGSSCSNRDGQPRFSVSGRSCGVPGAELFALANITRLPYARGPEAECCPKNLAQLTSVEACQDAASAVGAVFKKQEEEFDWPMGCYEIMSGRWQGVYFNNATSGEAVSGARPLCETLPFTAPRQPDGSCPLQYKKIREGGECDLAMPFFVGELGADACPFQGPELMYSGPKSCRAAADLLNLEWQGEVTSGDVPTGCFFQGGQVAFNGDQGAASPSAAPVCQENFAFSVLDPRVTYTVTTLRFSQSGDAALVKAVATFARGDDCNVAYGRSLCQSLANQDPAKALMNADSFGYYVIDAGNPETFEV